MIGRAMDAVAKPAAKFFERKYMGALGVNRTMRLARAYNSLRYGSNHERRKRWYRDSFSELIAENGNPVAPVNEINDGWVIDTSGRLPYLEELLKDGGEIIDEKGGEKLPKHMVYRRPFFRIYFQKVTSQGSLPYSISPPAPMCCRPFAATWASYPRCLTRSPTA